MEISTLMHVSKALKNLKTPISDVSFREKLFLIFYKLVQVVLLQCPYEIIENKQQRSPTKVVENICKFVLI